MRKLQQKCQKCQAVTGGRCKVSTMEEGLEHPFNVNAEPQYPVLNLTMYNGAPAGFSLWHCNSFLRVKSVVQMSLKFQLKM